MLNLDQDTFISQYVTTFLATQAANEYTKCRAAGACTPLSTNEADIEIAFIQARHAWYTILKSMYAPMPSLSQRPSQRPLQSRVDDAADWLREYFSSDEPMRAKILRRDAYTQGISSETLDQAADLIGVRRTKLEGYWYWQPNTQSSATPHHHDLGEHHQP